MGTTNNTATMLPPQGEIEFIAPKIFEAISNVMADMGVVGKKKKNTQQNFMYRGIDDVMNALAPALVKNKVFIVPDVTSEHREERTTAKGGTLLFSRLHITYKFYTTDGSFIEAKVVGEAMDSADKATNKAMSIAYKYACFQVFCIPTEEMQDPDVECHDVAPQEPPVEYVDAVKIKVLTDRMTQKGVKEEQILERYKVNSLEELTVLDFMKACNGLEKMPDVEAEQVDLGL